MVAPVVMAQVRQIKMDVPEVKAQQSQLQAQQLSTVQAVAAVLGVVTIAVLVLWKRLPWAGLRVIPAPLVAVVVGTVYKMAGANTVETCRRVREALGAIAKACTGSATLSAAVPARASTSKARAHGRSRGRVARIHRKLRNSLRSSGNTDEVGAAVP